MSGTPQKPGVAAERVVPNTGAVELPLLTKTSAERAKDRRALAAILRAVPPEMKAGLAVKKSAKEAWEAVKKMRVSDDRVKSANVQRLLKEFENVVFHDGESVDDFAMRINRLVASLRELGEAMEGSRVVKKILCVVPKKMKQVAVAIEMLLDLNTMSVEELVGRLRVAEEPRDVDEETGGAGRLLLTEEQWEARRRRRGGNARRGGGGDKGSGSHVDDDGGSSTCSGTSGRSERRNRGKCFNCGIRGHLARDCQELKKERAFLADAGEEPCLL